MTLEKKVQIRMLPTESGNRLLYLSEDTIPYLLSNWRGNAQELYLTSDEKVEENDWCIEMGHKKIPFQIKEINNISGICRDEIGNPYVQDACRKIIATTNPDIKLHQLSQEFINHFIESYNKGDVITEALIEYEKVYNGYRHKDGEWQLKLKLNQDDDTIAIKRLKDNWNREELIEVLRRYNDANCTFFLDTDKKDLLNNWIEKNI